MSAACWLPPSAVTSVFDIIPDVIIDLHMFLPDLSFLLFATRSRCALLPYTDFQSNLEE